MSEEESKGCTEMLVFFVCLFICLFSLVIITLHLYPYLVHVHAFSISEQTQQLLYI